MVTFIIVHHYYLFSTYYTCFPSLVNLLYLILFYLCTLDINVLENIRKNVHRVKLDLIIIKNYFQFNKN